MTKRTKNLLFLSLNIILPILVGGLIYILFRSDHLLMFKWFKALNIDGPIYFSRIYVLQYKYLIPHWLLYSLPDGAWAYSFMIFLSLYFKKKFIYTLPGTIGALVEILQLWFVPGTFDIVDLFIIVLSTILAITVIKFNYRGE